VHAPTKELLGWTVASTIACCIFTLHLLLVRCCCRLSEHVYDSDAEGDAAGGASDDATGAGQAGRAADEPGDRGGGAGRGQAVLDPETVFMQVRGWWIDCWGGTASACCLLSLLAVLMLGCWC
jgi:hypothetical protein